MVTSQVVLRIEFLIRGRYTWETLQEGLPEKNLGADVLFLVPLLEITFK